MVLQPPLEQYHYCIPSMCSPLCSVCTERQSSGPPQTANDHPITKGTCTHIHTTIHIQTQTHTYIHSHTHACTLINTIHTHVTTTDYGTYSYNLHHPDIEGKSSIWRDLLSHAILPIAQAGRECDPSSLIETSSYQASIHPLYNVSSPQCYYVWSVVVKTVQ